MGFEEVDALRRLIPSLVRSGVKNILYFDGTFEYFPSDHDESKDGTLEYLMTVPEVTVIPCGRMTHIEKSTFRFKKAAELGFNAVVFIDCDEYMIGDFEQFVNFVQMVRGRHTTMDSYNLCLLDLNMEYKDRSVAQRVFFNPANFYYKDLHWVIFDKRIEQRVFATHTLGGIQIFHDSTIRPKNRDEQMVEFQRVYTPIETEEYRRKNGIIIPSKVKNQTPCKSCKTNAVGSNSIFCQNCWDYLHDDFDFGDVFGSMILNTELNQKEFISKLKKMIRRMEKK